MARALNFSSSYYYYADYLGTSRASVDENGNKCYDADYFPWGNEQDVFVNTCTQNYKFNGKELDPDMGVYDFGARFFQDGIARFYQPDFNEYSSHPSPVPYAKLNNPQSLNLYTYVLDNPLSLREVDGHKWNLPYNLGGEYYDDLLLQQAADAAGQAVAAQQQSGPTAKVKGNTVTYTYPDGSKVVLKGDHPFRDNNPGDLRSGHGSIGRDGGFAIYPSLQAGVDALGATLTGKYGDSSIADTMKAFAPASDGNDPVKYAATLASAVGVPASTKISALSSAQLMTFQYTIANAEGYSAAGNTASYTAPPQ
jgi:RHS repeat-associated protein